MSVMNLVAESAVTVKNTLEFPNLFGGTQIEYYRGFEVFGVPIYWYGVLIAVGIVLACVYAFHRMEKFLRRQSAVFSAREFISACSLRLTRPRGKSTIS